MRSRMKIIAVGALLLVAALSFAGCSAEDVLNALSDTPTYSLTASPSGTGSVGSQSGSVSISHSTGVAWISVLIEDGADSVVAAGDALTAGTSSTNTSVPVNINFGTSAGSYRIADVTLYNSNQTGGPTYPYNLTNWYSTSVDTNYSYINASHDGTTLTTSFPGVSGIAVGSFAAAP